jgi:hypothetical protein
MFVILTSSRNVCAFILCVLEVSVLLKEHTLINFLIILKWIWSQVAHTYNPSYLGS